MNKVSDWRVTEKSDTHFCAEDINGYWRVYQKWDGCFELTRSMNRPIDEADADDITTMHICDMSDIFVRLIKVCLLTEQNLPNTDASKMARPILDLIRKEQP